jgi:hypothetical protein
MNYYNATQKKMSRRTKLVLCSLFIVLFIACEQPAGNNNDDDEDDTFTLPVAPTLPTGARIPITTEAELQAIGTNATARRKYYELKNDIEVTDWMPPRHFRF